MSILPCFILIISDFYFTLEFKTAENSEIDLTHDASFGLCVYSENCTSLPQRQVNMVIALKVTVTHG